MTEYLHVFVYGTLKPGAANFDRYCRNQVMISQPADIDGDLYDFPELGYPAITHGAGTVHGYLLSFADPGILANLDELEDYDPLRSPATNLYTRELVTTYTPTGNPSCLAWVYLMTPAQISRCGGVLLPAGDWHGSKIL